MNKVLILVEGQTEETFVKRVLYPHLLTLEVLIVPIIISTKRVKSGPSFKGGIPSYAKVRKEINRLLGDSSAALVTTMVDFYGLPASFPGRGAVQGNTPLERVAFVESALDLDINHERFLAYCSLHEFEALLFAAPEKIADAFGAEELRLFAIRHAFPSPEDIDDCPLTSPSARLRALYPQYGKVFYGSRIATSIGLQTMRAECGHFNDWLTRLEMLSDTPDNPDQQ